MASRSRFVLCPRLPLIRFNNSVCVYPNGCLGVRERLFGYTQTVVWAYANANNSALNSLLPAAIRPVNCRLFLLLDAQFVENGNEALVETLISTDTFREGNVDDIVVTDTNHDVALTL